MKRFGILFILTTTLLTACYDKENDYAQLSSDAAVDSLNCSNGFIEVRVSTNGSWVLESSETWLVVAQTNGDNSNTVQIAFNSNVSTASRQATLTLKSGSATNTLTLTQLGLPDLNGKSGNSNTLAIARRFEMPALKQGNLFRTYKTFENNDSIVDFSLEWNPERHHSQWVAYRFDNITSQVKWKRANWQSTPWGGDPFQEDPTLPEAVRTTLASYKGSGYDRGHICPSGDRLYSRDANEYTYYLSNMSPQLNSFNSGIWLELENITRQWGYSNTLRDTLYVCKGATIDEANTLKIVNNMPVPKYYFMAFVAQKGSSYKGIAFLLEHKKYTSPYDLKPFAISIDELEQKTGIDFFCNFPDDIENQVEKEFTLTDWTWKY